MATETAVLIENLSKRYRRVATRAEGRADDAVDAAEPWFWALRDIDMCIERGEVAGFIGHNGAGKSTLLKIISGITKPTSGSVKIRGRVASLLEVGTGFHPELTGRENVYLNAAILGIPRSQVSGQFDEIVEFSGVGQFIDAPVKHFSSGMVVRLGFSVAAHLDAEIMIIDEVLSVGDLEFQERSAERIKKIVTGQGRTVIMVSHNLSSVTELCSRCFLLSKGRVIDEGTSGAMTDEYISTVDDRQQVASVRFDGGEAPGDDVARLVGAGIVDGEGSEAGEVDLFSAFSVEFRYRVAESRGRRFLPAIWLHSAHGQVVLTSMVKEAVEAGEGIFESTCHIPGEFLNEGCYYVSVSLSSVKDGTMVTHINEDQLLRFIVTEDISANPRRFGYRGVYPGVLRPDLSWQTEKG